MDGAILVIAANEQCPQPQTKEHLQALNISGIKNIIIVQNKIDLVSKEEALKNYDQIKEFLKNSIAEKAPIIPISANYKINLDILLEAMEKEIPTPKRDLTKNPKMLIARSFDINKPNSKINSLKGGILGGSVLAGTLKIEDEIEILPGASKNKSYLPLKSKIISLSTKEGPIKEAHPGGLIGIGTTLDPSLTKGDNLIGNIIGLKGKMPKVQHQITIKTNLFERFKKEPLKINEAIVISAGTSTTVGVVTKTKKGDVEMNLKKPICVEKKDKVGISRKTRRWELMGYGEIQ